MSTVHSAFPDHLAGVPLLALAPGSAVLELARAWFPDAAWEQVPVSAAHARLRPRSAAAGRARSLLSSPRAMRLLARSCGTVIAGTAVTIATR